MKVLISPKLWRVAVEGRHILLSVLATYYGDRLSRHWVKVI